MKVIIKEEMKMEVLSCDRCGSYPVFKHDSPYYTDTWLECPKCGRRTWNKGGYHYASEIPLEMAKEAAVAAWNNREFKEV